MLESRTRQSVGVRGTVVPSSAVVESKLNFAWGATHMNHSSDQTPHPYAGLRSGMSTAKFIIGLALWTLVLGAVFLIVVRRYSPDQKEDSAAATNAGLPTANQEQGAEPIEATQQTVIFSLPSRELPDFEFQECMGDTISLEKMKGKRWLASFVFTRCVMTCPQMTRDISELHRRVEKLNPDFQFVTFTVDPDNDTAEVMKKYAETFQADHKRWKFATGDKTKIHDLIRSGFTQFVEENVGEKRKPGYEVDHSNRAVLINEDGIPVGSFLMTVPGDVVQLRRIIEGKEEFPTPGPGGLSFSSGENPSVPLTLVPVKDADEPDPDAVSDKDRTTKEDPDDAAGAIQKQEDGESSAKPDAPKTSDSPETPQAKNKRIDELLPAGVGRMPSINAALNSGCIVLLISGLVAIKGGHRTRHRNLMIASFVVSSAFLICYLAYHQLLHQYTQFRGRAFDGSLTATRVYFSILIPHVVLAALVPILALRVFYLAFQERWPEHRWLARITFPIWLFVSVTGVVIYGMLYHWPWPSTSASISLAQ